MSDRDINWFYNAEDCSIMHLSPYLELYFQLFKDDFIATSEASSRYSFLSWIFSGNTNSKEIERSLMDPKILKLLSEHFDDKDLGSKTFLSQFDYHYFMRNKETLISWGYSLDSIKDRQKYLSWCYSWGAEIPYFKMTLKRVLEPSDLAALDVFEITKFFELTISGFELHESGMNDSKLLLLSVLNILFQYSRFRYPLSSSQLLQLSQPNIMTELYSVYCSSFGIKETNLKIKELDISPEIIKSQCSEV